MFCLHVCLCTTYMLGAHGGQKQVSDPMGLELETTPCGCWEVNPGPLEQQQVLLTSRLSLQPPNNQVIKGENGASSLWTVTQSQPRPLARALISPPEMKMVGSAVASLCS